MATDATLIAEAFLTIAESLSPSQREIPAILCEAPDNVLAIGTVRSGKA